MPIPRNTTSLLDKLKNATGKKPAPKTVEKKPVLETEELNGAPNAGREAAKLRQRAKKAESELETITAERDLLKSEVDTLRPKAKQWDDYDHVQRSKLTDSLPAELRKEAKGMSLAHLQLLVKNVGGNGGGSGKPNEPTTDLSKETDLMKLQKSGDTKAINEYVAKVKSGTLIPAQPKAEVAA